MFRSNDANIALFAILGSVCLVLAIRLKVPKHDHLFTNQDYDLHQRYRLRRTRLLVLGVGGLAIAVRLWFL
jgi:hypothetical protein